MRDLSAERLGAGKPADRASRPCIGPNEVQTSPGVAGNARLTGAVAAALLVLLAAEGATIPFIGPLLGPHIFIGMLLIPPVSAEARQHRLPLRPLLLRQPALRPQGPSEPRPAGARARRRPHHPGAVRHRRRPAGRRAAEQHLDLRPQAELHRLGRADDAARSRAPARGPGPGAPRLAAQRPARGAAGGRRRPHDGTWRWRSSPAPRWRCSPIPPPARGSKAKRFSACV